MTYRLLHIVCSVVLLMVALPVSAQTPLCKDTAEKLGGSLVFDKNYHEGASFILTLPINLTQK